MLTLQKENEEVKKKEIDEIEDYGTLDIDEDDLKIEYPNFSIKIDRVQYSIFEMKRRYDRDMICIDPSFQRNYVWTKPRQKSELIESVVMGIPLPLIYLAENKDGQLIVVDGRQRLTTFFDFLNNKFSLKGLKIMKAINDKKFKDLENENPQYATMIEDFQLVVQIIKYPTPDRVRFDIFDRVNRGGTSLNKQEMRNALYQGKATELLDKLSESNDFKYATGKGVSSQRMKDKYIILRAVAFYLWNEGMLKDERGKLIEYKSDMEEFLGKVMQYLNDTSDKQVEEIGDIFINIMRRSFRILGQDAFRIPSNYKKKRPISMTLFESIFYFLYLSKNIEDSYVKKIIDKLLKDGEFIKSLEHAIDSSSQIETRFNIIKKKYKEVLNDN
ncbi:DUF262 domain-containing protein [Candidatus Clostridium helianthi]|uniref:DUF262 domain-containing protein n=1 Tax=Candidatus Clostridium helianthi TaxID=3381660 RepID=A0ABW8S4P5_9CLOT